jgi:hypothetical protein
MGRMKVACKAFALCLFRLCNPDGYRIGAEYNPGVSRVCTGDIILFCIDLLARLVEHRVTTEFFGAVEQEAIGD